eukprot:SAG11_NODE_2081_length_3851_cov_2.513859_5_plen_115_part_00
MKNKEEGAFNNPLAFDTSPRRLSTAGVGTFEVEGEVGQELSLDPANAEVLPHPSVLERLQRVCRSMCDSVWMEGAVLVAILVNTGAHSSVEALHLLLRVMTMCHCSAALDRESS